jgi:SAM-dependent methyltransferase
MSGNADPSTARVSCRFCGEGLVDFLDLGMSPLCESFLSADQLNSAESFYPLAARVCPSCFLVQLQEYVAPERIFTEYAYFSAFSTAWLEHARHYAAAMRERLALGPASRVIELGSNDGYLLQFFAEKGVPVLGIEPAANVAAAARARGVPTRVEFFGTEAARRLADEDLGADLVVANNVLAQVPDVNSFVAGIRLVLKPDGMATIEFPHLLRTIEGNQFDQVYHEHFSYFSALTAERIFAAHGLRIFDAEELWTHGGSLRLHVCHAGATRFPSRPSLARVIDEERRFGIDRLETYAGFVARVHATKRALLRFLIDQKAEGRRIAGYGAPGKGNTLLNYCGIRTDFLDYTVDRNPYKHGRYLPGTHIPIFPPDKIAETRPDFVLILPWNLKDEIMAQLAYVRDWGAKFVVPIPALLIV